CFPYCSYHPSCYRACSAITLPSYPRRAVCCSIFQKDASINERGHWRTFGEASSHTFLIAQPCGVDQHLAGPSVDIELKQQRPHRSHSVLLLFPGHRQRGGQ